MHVSNNITLNTDRDSAVVIATGCMVQGSNPGGGEIFRTGPGTYPISYTVDTGSFLAIKRQGHDVDHPLPSTAEVEDRVEL